MAFDYNTGVKNKMLSMSLDSNNNLKFDIGFGTRYQYSGSNLQTSLTGAFCLTDTGIFTTSASAFHVYVTDPLALSPKSDNSASISSLVLTHSTADEPVQVIFRGEGELEAFACSANCYQGETFWAFPTNAQANPPIAGGTISYNLYNPTFQQPDNRQYTRSLKGGVSITSRVTSTNFLGAGSVGTMGGICQDSSSKALVGVTNAHVVVRDPFYTSERNTSSIIENEFDIVDGNNPGIPGFTTASSYTLGTSHSYWNTVFQDGEFSAPTASQPVVVSGSKEIGRVVRYVPLHTSASTITSTGSFVNKVDAALFSIYCSSSNGLPLIGFSSSMEQLGLNYTSSITFASTAEIDDLPNSNPPLYSSGRTTGVKGFDPCPLRFLGFTNATVGYKLQGTQTPAYFQDVIQFIKPQDSASYHPTASAGSALVCPYPAYRGDSGSTLIAEISGSFKIIGLVFAGNGGQYLMMHFFHLKHLRNP